MASRRTNRNVEDTIALAARVATIDAMAYVRPFLRLARLHFLLGGALLFALGALAGGEPDRWGYVLGQAMVTAAQVTAHFVNEYADVEVDRRVVHRTWFSGGSGVLTAGTLSPQVALRAAIVTTVMTCGLAIAVADRSLPAAALGLASLGVSWLYSIPPVRLLATGWGEVATSLVVAVFVPLIGAWATGGMTTTGLWWSVAALFAVHVGTMLAFELPDLATDRAAGKTVLAVRLGRSAAVLVMVGFWSLAAVIVVLGAATDVFAGTWLGVPAVLAAGVASWATLREHHHLLTAGAVATLVLTAVALIAAN